MDLKAEIIRYIPTDIPQAYLAGGEPLFYAFECVLIETKKHNGYTYTAVNISNGRRRVIRQ